MKLLLFIGGAALLAAATALHGAESVDEALKRATLDYQQRLGQANAELGQTRERIAREKAPLLAALRAAEDRIVAAEAETTRLETGQERFAETRRRLTKEADALRKNENYLNTLGRDGLTAFEDGLLPGERSFLPDRVAALRASIDDPARLAGGLKAVEVADLLLERVEHSLGGYTAGGLSPVEGDNRLATGTFAFVGPEAFFRRDQDGAAGPVRVREGTGRPIAYLQPGWKPEQAAAFFAGKTGTMLADASGGKALRLLETKGTLWQHINKGGMVSYAILCVGLFSLGLILLKLRDLVRMGVDAPGTVQGCLDSLAAGATKEAEVAMRALKTNTKELFAAGLRYAGRPKEQLEEHLYAVLLRQRLHYERRLPLLAVIATAAPLMGLLGTVTGMVRTFALITVFGTGNAGKLASGISEVLVATELGLMVAIPTLVAHGFLSHRIQRNLSLLERYALEFTTAVQAGRSGAVRTEAVAP